MGRIKILVTLGFASCFVTLNAASCGGGTIATSTTDGSTTIDGTTTSDTDGTTTPNPGTDGSGVITPTDSGGNPATCPGAAPNNQATCANGDGPCVYGNAVCDCGGGANPVWTCTTCPACPATQPDPDAGTCTVASQACAALARCDYGTTQCECAPGGAAAGAGTWACGTCPATEPTGTCTTVDLSCMYNATNCTCRRVGQNDTWVCETPPPPCPTTEPTAGMSCVAATGGAQGCAYGKTTCRCFPAGGDAGDEWSCN